MDAKSTVITIAIFLTVVIAGLILERLAPAQKQSFSASRFNLGYTAIYLFIQSLIVPALSVVTVAAVNAVGGGWITLPASGSEFWLAFVSYVLTVDLMEYIFHRAQHRIPALWSMHSLHHSDITLNASTTSRHYWAEHGIKMLSIYMVVGLLFKAPLEILGAYVVLSYYNVFLHMNIRVGFGRFSVLLNSPQYHRLHHSVLPEHYDRNFAALFPGFDLLFGTYRRPHVNEYPPTGLDTGDQPTSYISAILWPARSLINSRAMQ